LGCAGAGNSEVGWLCHALWMDCREDGLLACTALGVIGLKAKGENKAVVGVPVEIQSNTATEATAITKVPTMDDRKDHLLGAGEFTKIIWLNSSLVAL
jgi:hypothetical protein